MRTRVFDRSVNPFLAVLIITIFGSAATFLITSVSHVVAQIQSEQALYFTYSDIHSD